MAARRRGRACLDIVMRFGQPFQRGRIEAWRVDPSRCVSISSEFRHRAMARPFYGRGASSTPSISR